jgi:hypothetical protein
MAISGKWKEGDFIMANKFPQAQKYKWDMFSVMCRI